MPNPSDPLDYDAREQIRLEPGSPAGIKLARNAAFMRRRARELRESAG
jgi:hypothetical protein